MIVIFIIPKLNKSLNSSFLHVPSNVGWKVFFHFRLKSFNRNLVKRIHVSNLLSESFAVVCVVRKWFLINYVKLQVGSDFLWPNSAPHRTSEEWSRREVFLVLKFGSDLQRVLDQVEPDSIFSELFQDAEKRDFHDCINLIMFKNINFRIGNDHDIYHSFGSFSFAVKIPERFVKRRSFGWSRFDLRKEFQMFLKFNLKQNDLPE